MRDKISDFGAIARKMDRRWPFRICKLGINLSCSIAQRIPKHLQLVEQWAAQHPYPVVTEHAKSQIQLTRLVFLH